MKHLSWAGGHIYVTAEDLMLDEFEGKFVEMPIEAVEFPEGEDWGCDFCTGPSVAAYEVNAVSVLGEGGNNTFYCHGCATRHAMSQPSPEFWVHKGEAPPREVYLAGIVDMKS